MTGDPFQEIADLAATLRAGYPETARKYRLELENISTWRTALREQDGEHPIHKPSAEEFLATARHGCDSWEMVCEQFRQDLGKLTDLVFEHLPEVAEKHGVLTRAPQRWELKPIEEWTSLMAALRAAEVTAFQAIRNPVQLSPSNAASQPPATADASSADEMELKWRKMVAAIGDEGANQIVAIAGQTGLNADEKMLEIVKLDRRFAGKDSNTWGTLLGVTAAAIRGTNTWKQLQEAKKSKG